MAKTPKIVVDTAYSVIHPMYEKVLKTLHSSTSVEQLEVSEKYIDNFLSFIEQEKHLGIYPTGYCRTILSSYYGAKLRDEYIACAKALNNLS